METWRKVPRDLITASFQRTGFRTDDYSLEICCNSRDLETGMSFKKFVTFDDYLSANTSHKQCEFTSRSHGYNLRTRKAVKFNALFNFAIDSKERARSNHVEVNGNLKGISVETDIDWKRKNSLKRSHVKVQLDEDIYEEAISSDESTSRKNEDVLVIPMSARPSKVIDIRTIESVPGSSKSDDVHPTTRANVNESSTSTEYDSKLGKTANNEERYKNNQVLSNERSIGSPEVENANDDSIALQQVFDGTSVVDSDTKGPRDEIESADLDGNVGCFPQKSLKRRSVSVEESRSNDGEPERKRSRFNSDWMKQHETAFVFGPFDLARTVTTVSADSDNGAPQSMRPRRSCETERSIFTIRPRRD